MRHSIFVFCFYFLTLTLIRCRMKFQLTIDAVNERLTRISTRRGNEAASNVPRRNLRGKLRRIYDRHYDRIWEIYNFGRSIWKITLRNIWKNSSWNFGEFAIVRLLNVGKQKFENSDSCYWKCKFTEHRPISVFWYSARRNAVLLPSHSSAERSTADSIYFPLE